MEKFGPINVDLYLSAARSHFRVSGTQWVYNGRKLEREVQENGSSSIQQGTALTSMMVRSVPDVISSTNAMNVRGPIKCQIAQRISLPPVGSTLPGKWTSTSIRPDVLTTYLILELYTVVLSSILWGKIFSNKTIELYTDNLALVPIINKY